MSHDTIFSNDNFLSISPIPYLQNTTKEKGRITRLISAFQSRLIHRCSSACGVLVVKKKIQKAMPPPHMTFMQ